MGIIILGIILIGVGTYVTFISSNKSGGNKTLILVIGIFFIAGGTLLTIYGPLKKSKESEARILKEIERTQEQTDSRISEALKSNDLSAEKKEEIEAIGNEFDEWAKGLKGDFEQKKIELQKVELDDQANRIELNKKWKHIYVDFFGNMSQLIDAVNNNLGYNIVYNFPAFPENIFNTDYQDYIATIDFTNNIQWGISFHARESSDYSIFPNIRVYIRRLDQNNFPHTLDEFVIALEPGTDEYLLFLRRNDYLNLSAINVNQQHRTPYNYSSILKKMQEIIELQLIEEY